MQMTDEENTGVEEASTQPTESEIKQDVQMEEVQQAPQRQRSNVEYNWSEARRMRESLERRNLELEEQIKNLSSRPSQEDDLAKLAEDDIITVGQARRLQQKEARQIAEDVIRRREAETMEERLQLKYQDFNQVVTKENIEILQQNEPELAMSLQGLAHDPYAQAQAAYKLLKKFGLGVSQEVAKNKEKATENSKKPVSVQSVTKQSSAIGNVHNFENGLTPELKKHLWKEMQDSRKNG